MTKRKRRELERSLSIVTQVNRERENRACVNKVRYVREFDAFNAGKYASAYAFYGSKEFRTYYCLYCHGFHLTKKR